jgi:hypothetical protein
MITLSEAKQHLRVMHAQDDQYIEHLIDAAEGHVSAYLGDDLPDPAPAPIKSAVLLLVGDLYENRERQSTVTLHGNRTFEMLLAPYRTHEVL